MRCLLTVCFLYVDGGLPSRTRPAIGAGMPPEMDIIGFCIARAIETEKTEEDPGIPVQTRQIVQRRKNDKFRRIR